MTRFGSIADPAVALLISGARVLDPGSGTDGVRDLAVAGGRFVEPEALPPDAERVDASGLLAIPALCDLHAHLRQPGVEEAETVESGARAAAHGGYATLCAMPNTAPPLDEPARVRDVLAAGIDAACRVRVIGAATRGRAGEQPTELAALAEVGVVGVSDDGAAVSSPRVASALLTYLGPLGIPLIEHAEDPELAAGSAMRAGPIATRLGLGGWPASAELAVVERDIALAEETGAWVHFTHLSTAAAVEAVRRAKARGLRITCDVTPHHLAMTDAWVAGHRGFAWEEPSGIAAEPFAGTLDEQLAYDGACRVNPPLPARDDALALLSGVADGTVDAVATDHAPHPPQRKAVEFAAAAPGMIGLETALSLGLAAVAAGVLGLAELVSALSLRPASLIGERRSLEPGSGADLVLVDPRARWRVEPGTLASRSRNTPLLGRELPGVVRLTMADGRITYEDGLLPAS
ncbi:MAG TPA: dihydroorotase [candidate division Zixibacteria bacterium]|nr:dihydroorotase [candidate division Zixibacteria bacterium]